MFPLGDRYARRLRKNAQRPARDFARTEIAPGRISELLVLTPPFVARHLTALFVRASRDVAVRLTALQSSRQLADAPIAPGPRKRD
jgi:hypothetical protein